MDCQKSFPFWDEKKNFYEFSQNGKEIFIKKDGEIIFESCLLRLKKVDEYPVRPFIMNGKLFLFNYDRGIEIHRLDGSEQKFFDVRAVWQAVFTDSILFLQKQVHLVTIDLEKEEVIEKISVTESFQIIELDRWLLFYQFKRRKSYLYNIQTKVFIELPKFGVKFSIITKVIKKAEKLIVFYCASEELENRNGVYIHDLQKQKGEFYCGLADFSANCHKYLPILNFSFNEIQDVIVNDENYIEYLYFILKQFGLFALLYYSKNAKLDQLDDSLVSREIKSTVQYFTEKMSCYPKFNQEAELLFEEIYVAEKRLKLIIS